MSFLYYVPLKYYFEFSISNWELSVEIGTRSREVMTWHDYSLVQGYQALENLKKSRNSGRQKLWNFRSNHGSLIFWERSCQWWRFQRKVGRLKRDIILLGVSTIFLLPPWASDFTMTLYFRLRPLGEVINSGPPSHETYPCQKSHSYHGKSFLLKKANPDWLVLRRQESEILLRSRQKKMINVGWTNVRTSRK